MSGLALVAVAVSYAFDPNSTIPLVEARGTGAEAGLPSETAVHSLIIESAGPLDTRQLEWVSNVDSEGLEFVSAVDGMNWHGVLPGQFHRAVPWGGAPRFTWVSAVPASSWRVVLLDEFRREIAWSGSRRQTKYRPEGEFRAALMSGRGCYWYAIGDAVTPLGWFGFTDAKADFVRSAPPLISPH